MNALKHVRDTLESIKSALRPSSLPKAIDSAFAKIPSPAGELFVYEDTRGEGAPIVLVHSINAAASSYEMRPIFEAFRGQRPVLAFDLPGFGLSERGARRHDRELYRDAIVTVLERALTHYGIAADVVALSLGSELAALAAQARPELVRSLTMISPTGFGKPKEPAQRTADEARTGRLRVMFENPLVAAPLFAVVASAPSIRYFLAKSFVGPVHSGLAGYAWLSAHQPGARHAPLTFLSGALFDPDVLTTVYEHLTCPVLVLYDEDAYTDFSRLPQALAWPGWTATRIAPSRGLPQFDQPARTHDALRRFWAPLQIDEARMEAASAHQAGF